MKREEQLSFSSVSFDRHARPTRRPEFLAQMDADVPWSRLVALIERMLRIYFLQQWFNLADPAVEETLYDSLHAPVRRHRFGKRAGS